MSEPMPDDTMPDDTMLDDTMTDDTVLDDTVLDDTTLAPATSVSFEELYRSSYTRMVVIARGLRTLKEHLDD